jgi:tetratricopeptide (TPR) repeat protein
MPSYDSDDDVVEINAEGVFDLAAPTKKDKAQAVREKVRVAGERMGEPDMTPEKLIEGNKSRGNEAYSEKKYDNAIDCYTSGITMANKCGLDTTALYSNRAMARLKMGGANNLKKCVDDCDAAIKADPDCVKAFYRKAQAQQGLNKTIEAIDTLTQAQEVASDDANICSLLKKLKLSQVKTLRPASSYDQESRYICIQAMAMSEEQVRKLPGDHQATIRNFREDPELEPLREDVAKEVEMQKKNAKNDVSENVIDGEEAVLDPLMVEACRAAMKMTADQVRTLRKEQRTAVEQMRLNPSLKGLRDAAAKQEADLMMEALKERNTQEAELDKRVKAAAAAPPAPPADSSAAPVADESGKSIYIASDDFNGRKEGYVFKKGAQGVGYYLDRRGKNGVESSSYYHFDSEGNKLKNKWDDYDVDAELDALDGEEPGTRKKEEATKKKESMKEEQRRLMKTAARSEKDYKAMEDDMTFDPEDDMYKNMPPEQQHAIRMALSVTDEQLKQMPEKDKAMLKQFRDVHKQRKKMAAEEARRVDMAKNPQLYGDEGVQAALKAEKAKTAKTEEKDPEVKLKKQYPFLGEQKKWSSEHTPASTGDGQARSVIEQVMIDKSKSEARRVTDRKANKERVRRYKEGGEGQSLAMAGQCPGEGEVRIDTKKGNTFDDGSKLLHKITNSHNSKEKKDKKKKAAKKDKNKQFASIKKMMNAKSTLGI